MKAELLDLLACPVCKSHPLALQVEKEKGGEIVEGLLTCPKCLRTYLIHDTIPNLIPDEGR